MKKCKFLNNSQFVKHLDEQPTVNIVFKGLKLNNSKTEALWKGANAKRDFKLCPEKGFKWPCKKVKAFGVWL